MRCLVLGALAATLFALPAGAQQLDARLPTCFACHGENGQSQLPITSLAYFASLIEEVSLPQIPISYWDHVRRRMEGMEKRWLQKANSATATNAGSAEASSPEVL